MKTLDTMKIRVTTVLPSHKKLERNINKAETGHYFLGSNEEGGIFLKEKLATNEEEKYVTRSLYSINEKRIAIGQ